MHLDPYRFRLVFAIFVILGPVASLRAAQFHVTVGSEATTAGSTITIPIVITAETVIGAAQLELLYDPERMRWVGGDAGKLTANTLIEANLLEPGRVKIAFAGGEDVAGTGTIYRAALEWTGDQTAPAAVRFSGVRAWDQITGLELATSAAPGEAVRVIATSEATGVSDQPIVSPLSPNVVLYSTIVVLVILLVAAGFMLLRMYARNA